MTVGSQKRTLAALRAALFALLAIIGLIVFPALFNSLVEGSAILVISALSTFAAAAVSNVVLLRLTGRGNLAAIGLGWNSKSQRNVALGLIGGIGAALAVVLIPVAARAALIEHEPGLKTEWGGLVFISIVLLFGAAGEEMLFHGYAFQILMREFGPFTVILPFGILFGIAHTSNRSITFLGVANTVLWGILLGYAFWRSGDLWLPLGLHFGWNWTLPLLGSNLSGFTMNLTGYAVGWRAGALWSGGAYGPEAGLPAGLAAVALFFYLHKAPFRRQDASLLR